MAVVGWLDWGWGDPSDLLWSIPPLALVVASRLRRPPKEEATPVMAGGPDLQMPPIRIASALALGA